MHILSKLEQDIVPFLYLISDILFNTTTTHYIRIFSRLLTFILYKFIEITKGETEVEKKLKGEVEGLLHVWKIKFIFEENYIRGLLYLIETHHEVEKKKEIHQIISKIGDM